jgi:hypothetical protein
LAGVLKRETSEVAAYTAQSGKVRLRRIALNNSRRSRIWYAEYHASRFDVAECGDRCAFRWPFCSSMRRPFHRSFRLTAHRTAWADLPRLWRHLLWSIVMVLFCVPFGFALGFGASAIGAVADTDVGIVVVALMLFSFGCYAVSFFNLAFWRCPACNKSFFGTTLFYCVPFGNTCRNCCESPPSS